MLGPRLPLRVPASIGRVTFLVVTPWALGERNWNPPRNGSWARLGRPITFLVVTPWALGEGRIYG